LENEIEEKIRIMEKRKKMINEKWKRRMEI
jgi:hypothetical protein